MASALREASRRSTSSTASPALRHLRRLLGTQAAEDAFQETFLRALRAYASLRHADNLRGWVLTIATHVAVDESRRKRPIAVADVPDLESVDEPLPREELRRLTADLPPTERAAVCLRYGYDLGYDEIAVALGSSPDAARQATSSGVRRLRKEGEPVSTAPADLDRRFREAAAAEGLVDVAYELHDSPVGQLLVAATDRGLCRISYSPEFELERIAHAYGRRVLRVPAAASEARRQLDEYFELSCSARVRARRPGGRREERARPWARVRRCTW